MCGSWAQFCHVSDETLSPKVGRSGPGSRLVGNNQTNNVQIMTFHFSNLKQDAKVSEVTV